MALLQFTKGRTALLKAGEYWLHGVVFQAQAQRQGELQELRRCHLTCVIQNCSTTVGLREELQLHS